MPISLWSATIISPCVVTWANAGQLHVICKSLKLQIIVKASNLILPKAVVQCTLKISPVIKDQSSSRNALEDKQLIACFVASDS